MMTTGNLFAQLQQYDVAPAPKPSPVDDGPGFVVTLKNTRSGVPIMVCNIDPPPQEAVDRAVAADVPLFVGREIQLMRDLDPITVDSIITAKRVFPGCDIKDIIKDSV